MPSLIIGIGKIPSLRSFRWQGQSAVTQWTPLGYTLGARPLLHLQSPTGHTLTPRSRLPRPIPMAHPSPPPIVGPTWRSYDFYTYNTSVPTGGHCVDGNATCAVPLFATMALIPLGRRPPIGYQNTTWKSLKMAAPPDAKFHIAGADTCPQSKTCDSQGWQAHRLGGRQYHTFAKYLRVEM